MKKRRIDLVEPAAERKPCEAGSLEQQLDMCESGPLRGDEVQFNHGVDKRREVNPELSEDLMEHNFDVTMSEEGREGDEASGDEHSAGLQGDEQQELQYDDKPAESDAGVPGEADNKEAHRNPA